MRLADFLVLHTETLWIQVPGEETTWYPATVAFARIPPAHLASDVLVTTHPDEPRGHLWIEELATGYAWRLTHPGPKTPEVASMAVRWRAWLRNGRR